MQMTNLIGSPRNAIRAIPRLPMLIAVVVAVVSGLLLASALTSPTARAQQLTEPVWTATMTVGTATLAGVTHLKGYHVSIPDGALSPATFPYAGETLTVNYLTDITAAGQQSLRFGAGRQLPGLTLHLGDRKFQIANAVFDQGNQEYTWSAIDDLGWSAGDTVQVRLEWEAQTARGEPINYRLTVGETWASYELEPDLYYCKVQCYWEGHRFVVNLQVNRRYIVEVDTELNSKDPRLFEVEPRAVPNMFISNSTMSKDRVYISERSHYSYSGGQTNVIVDNHLYGYPLSTYGNGDFFIRVEGSNGYNERTEAYRIRVRDVTPPLATSSGDLQTAKSGTAQAAKSGRLVRADSGGSASARSGVTAIADPEPLAAAFQTVPESHGGSAFTMRLGFTEEFSLTVERLRANLSVTGGQLTTVAQQVAGQNRNWNVTITPNQLETVSISLATTGDCDAANAICAWAGKPLTDTFTVAVPHYTIPRVTDVTVTGGPGDNGAWDTGETATIEVQFNKAVTVSGLPGEEPTLGILIGGTRRQAAYAGGSGTDKLTFSHPVTAEDAGTTSVEVVDNGITLGETGIADSHGQAAVLTFDYYTYLSTTAPPIRALFKGLPASHGESGFTFELTFSEAPDNLSYLTLQGDDENPGLLSVTNAVVDGVRPLETGQNRRWEVTVTPSGADPVTITLAANRNCAEASAICKDARRLAGPVTATVIGRASTGNTAAAGAPTITGAAQVGETLTASTSAIEDDDGTDDATFAYQWLADDIAISGATGSTYTLASDHEGKTIKVRVSFTDDAGNEETLTSVATGEVEAPPDC